MGGVMKCAPMWVGIALLVMEIFGCKEKPSEHRSEAILLDSSIVEVTSRAAGSQNDTTVFLIGENHASAEVQTQLILLLESLYKNKSLDAIFIEGSNGPVDPSRTVESLAAVIDHDKLPEYWRQQVAWGKISGYEYFSLMHPEIPVYGIEDMGAKERFAQRDVWFNDKYLRSEQEELSRARQVCEATLDSLRPQLPAEDLKEATALVNDCSKCGDLFLSRIQMTIKASAKYCALSRSCQNLFSKYQLLSQALGPVLKEYDSLHTLYGNSIVAYNGTLDSLKKNRSTEEENNRAYLALIAKKKTIESTELRIEAIEKVRGDEFTSLKQTVADLEEYRKQADQELRRLQPSAKAVNAASTAYKDAYYRAANSLLDLGQLKGQRFAAVENFFADQVAVQKKKEMDIGSELAERDSAMVANYQSIVNDRHFGKIAMIVGSAHIPSLSALMNAAGVKLTAMKLRACDKEQEPWEVAAWEGRSTHQDHVFTSQPVAAVNGNMKELTRLMDDLWIAEERTKTSLLTNIAVASGPKATISDLAGNTSIYEKIGDGDKSLRVGHFPFQRNGHYGNYLIDRGPCPGDPSVLYEVIDRQQGRTLAKDLSSKDGQFVFFYKTASEGEQRYVFATKTGEVEYREFMARANRMAANSRDRRIVLFGESDAIEENGTIVSPLWNKISEEPSGGGGGKEHPRNLDGANADFGGNGSEPPLFGRTINPARAQENLLLLAKQKNAAGNPVFIEEADFSAMESKLRFTPTTGEHSQIVVIVAKNVAEFRAVVRACAKAEKLKNKQVALITCGDAFKNTSELREDLLNGGVIQVWVPERLVSEAAAKKLVTHVKAVSESEKDRGATIDVIMDTSIKNWKTESPDDPDIGGFNQAGWWVLNRPVAVWFRG